MDQNCELRVNGKFVFGIIVAATLARVFSPPVLGHPSNFAPIAAISLFSGATLCGLARYIVPLGAILISDMVINFLYVGQFTFFYEGFYWQYLCYLAIAAFGTLLRERIGVASVLGASVLSSIFFFVVSNFGVWFSTPLYPPTSSGLVTCYLMAIPFFSTTLLGDLFYNSVMFGSWFLASRYLPLTARTA